MRNLKTAIAFIFLFSLSISLQAQINRNGIIKKATKEVEKPKSDNSNNMSNNQTQDEDYKGVAKMEVKTFWRQAEFFKNGKGSASNLSNMEKAVASIKQKDSSYNTSTMEAEIETCKVKVNKDNETQLAKKQEIVDNMNNGSDMLWNKVNADKLLDYLFFQSHTPGNPDSAELLAILNEYNTKAKELLAMDFGLRDRTNTKIRQYFAILDGKVSGGSNGKGGVNKDRPETDLSEMVGTNDADFIQKKFYRMQLSQAYWDAARKLFPQEANYEMMYQKRTATIAKQGSVEDVQKNIAKNNEEEIKNGRLPVPEIVDATVEKLFIDTFNKYLSEEMKGKAYKAILKQKDWGIIRNEITGIVMGRKRQAAIAYKGNDGKCYVRFGIIVEQQYIGGTFQSAKAFDARYGGGELPCEFTK